MATIKPFYAIRPAASVAEKVAALPYDVYSRAEARRVTARNPLSFLSIDRAETQFDRSIGIYDDCVYTKARELLDARIADGTFIMDSQIPCYYIYELTMDGRKQTGIVACSSVDDYANGIIKRHEDTREEKELDRIRHIDICSAQTGPIFMAYRSNPVINDIVSCQKQAEPIYDFTSEDQIRHTVWKIDHPDQISAVERCFASIPNTYIADGHHRAASAVKVALQRRKLHPYYDGTEEFNFFLSVLFPDDQLMIMPYNRVVRDLNGRNAEDFLSAVSRSFFITEVSSPYSPSSCKNFGMYLEERWYHLELRPELAASDPIHGLDVSILQEYLLEPVLGIDEPRTDKRIGFIGGIRGLEELERRCHTDMKVAFSMFPTSIQELFRVADAGQLMPPKSTWFEPKLRSGLFIHRIE